MNILLIEDNEAIISGLVYAFNKNNYNLISKTTVKTAKNYLENNTPNLIIIDISLPDGNGLDLYKSTIREMGIPVIFLSAKDEEEDIVLGLTLGAEDYITKPFKLKELLIRVDKIILRNMKDNVIRVKDISFDLDKMLVSRGNSKIELTSLELKILYLLFINIGKVVSRNMILEKIWEWTGNDVDDHTVTVYLKRIREKIDTDIITTIKGIGYRIDGK